MLPMNADVHVLIKQISITVLEGLSVAIVMIIMMQQIVMKVSLLSSYIS